MKIVSVLKRNRLIFLVLVVYSILLFTSPDKAIQSWKNSTYYLIEMLQVLPVIFLLTVVIEALVPKEMITKGFGEKSGIKGNLFSLLLGSISAGPIYAAFPISKLMLKKGASITNIVIILSSWAVIKIPMLANEVKFLGIKFMGIRWVLTVISIFTMGYFVALFVKTRDLPKPEMESKERILTIKQEYCIGCGVCVKLLPEYYEIRDNKAFVKQDPKEKSQIAVIVKMADKCPTKAIVVGQSKRSEEHTSELCRSNNSWNIFDWILNINCKWKNDAMVGTVCHKSFSSNVFWKSVLWICMSYEYCYDRCRMVFKKVKNPNK